MGNSQYALYAHLKPYSVTLQVGDVVTEGQKLGLLGNTGNTTERFATNDSRQEAVKN
jgi:murein DD-endopeptidase MepM/ murein hydrolase activator NlpD